MLDLGDYISLPLPSLMDPSVFIDIFKFNCEPVAPPTEAVVTLSFLYFSPCAYTLRPPLIMLDAGPYPPETPDMLDPQAFLALRYWVMVSFKMLRRNSLRFCVLIPTFTIISLMGVLSLIVSTGGYLIVNLFPWTM